MSEISSVSSSNSNNYQSQTHSTSSKNNVNNTSQSQQSSKSQQTSKTSTINTTDKTQLSSEAKASTTANANNASQSNKSNTTTTTTTSNSSTNTQNAQTPQEDHASLVISGLSDFFGDGYEGQAHDYVNSGNAEKDFKSVAGGFIPNFDDPAKGAKTFATDAKMGLGSILSEGSKANNALQNMTGGDYENFASKLGGAKDGFGTVAGAIGVFLDGKDIAEGITKMHNGDDKGQEQTIKGSVHMLRDARNLKNSGKATFNNIKDLVQSAKNGSKNITEEIANNGNKEVAKEIAESGNKELVKEIAKDGDKEIAKEIAKDGC